MDNYEKLYLNAMEVLNNYGETSEGDIHDWLRDITNFTRIQQDKLSDLAERNAYLEENAREDKKTISARNKQIADLKHRLEEITTCNITNANKLNFAHDFIFSNDIRIKEWQDYKIQRAVKKFAE